MSKMKEYLKSTKTELPMLVSAEYFSLTNWLALLKHISKDKSPYTNRKIDGVICQRIDMPYNKPNVSPPVYKLKLPSMNTIDFYLRWVNEEDCYYIYLYTNDYLFRTSCRKLPKINRYMQEHTGNDPHRPLPPFAYVLFASPFYSNVSKFRPRLQWNSKGYFKHCSEEATELMKDMLNDPMKYDRTIVELSFASDGWVPFRVRTDKQHSNSYYVGFSNMAVLFDPICPDRLDYFANEQQLTTEERTINIYHQCSHVLRQYMIETLFAEHKQRILEDNRLDYNSRHTKQIGYTNSEEEGETELPRLTGGNLDNVFVPQTFERCIYEDDREADVLSDITANDFDDLLPSFNQNLQNKRITYQRASETISLLDLAGGRGSDIYTFCNVGVTNLFAVDADRSALVKYARKRAAGVRNINWTPILHTTQIDLHDDVYFNVVHHFLSEDNSKLIKELQSRLEYPREGFDIIVMNYAFHYICYSKRAVEELGKTVARLLNKTHGIFIMSYIDGDKVLSLMEGRKLAQVPPFTIELVDRKASSDFQNGDEDMQLVKMPLPTIDASGYRIEPLVTRKYIDILSKHLKLKEEYNLVEAAKKYLEKIPEHTTATNYLSLVKVTIFESL